MPFKGISISIPVVASCPRNREKLQQDDTLIQKHAIYPFFFLTERRSDVYKNQGLV